MKKHTFHLITKNATLLADTITPVSIYLKLRDKFPGAILLESSDYHGGENSLSYICCRPIAGISVVQERIHTQFPDGQSDSQPVTAPEDVMNTLRDFCRCFRTDSNQSKHQSAGLFGYMAYDAVRYFDSVNIAKSDVNDVIPDLQYHIYQFVIVVNHFRNEAHLYSNSLDGDDRLDEIKAILSTPEVNTYGFFARECETSNCTDQEYLDRVRQGIQHCRMGDVFQVVLSRRFMQRFGGDEFNVYRTLRSINPSPYLFYFDYGSFKIFGSSPEAQLVIQAGMAEIHPIAGTFKRTGDDRQDMLAAERLAQDPKENAEHVMLVDLARNDLSRGCRSVQVEKFKEIQYYSHVIHLVSKVTGKMKADEDAISLAASTFPAGTLSGAPKVRAMQIIEDLEKDNRSFYGGCIGILDLNGNFNHAIIIRSFCSRDNVLYYQAGAGVVAVSEPESELREVENKVAVLRQAIQEACQIGLKN